MVSAHTTFSKKSNNLEFFVAAINTGERLDSFIASCLEGALSRQKVQQAIKEGAIFVDGTVITASSFAVQANSIVTAHIQLPSYGIIPEHEELVILYQDEEILLLNKPANLTVHPSPGNPEGTLVNRLVAQFPELAAQAHTAQKNTADESPRPGIVHRLDKDTSGLLLIGLTEEKQETLKNLFAQRQVHKVYLALVHGVPEKAQGTINAPMGRHGTRKNLMAVLPEGREAISEYEVLYADPKKRYALVQVTILTGRTHQIRVHMTHLGHPLLGDRLYTRQGTSLNNRTFPRQMLHAWKLSFPTATKIQATATITPSTVRSDGERLYACCPAPEDFMDAVAQLSGQHLRIVVTGLAGSGKSRLVQELRSLGMPSFSADACVQELYKKGHDGASLLQMRYGDRFISATGEVDKRALATAMRGSEVLRREIEKLVHPLIFHALEKFWEDSGASLVSSAEVPLYLEADMQGAHILIGVTCPFAERAKRLQQTRGWDKERIASTDSWQWADEKKMAACDIVINNTGTLEQLAAVAKKLYTELVKKAEQNNQQEVKEIVNLWQCV